IERGSQLSQFRWPAFNAALLAIAMRWLMLILILAGLLWLVAGALRRRRERVAVSKVAEGQPGTIR
ncbi:MAG: hypothetical protein L0Z53_03100, partial [Acidobacteriales bacterium]|nr:hypothetical protein [Terriglobales bacterium]